MKKTLAILLALLCLAGLTGVSALAEGEVVSSLAVGTVEGAVGSQASVPVSITGCAGVDSLQFNLNYDGSAIKIESVEPGQVFPAEYLVTNLSEQNRVRTACISAKGLTAEGVLMTLNCRILKEGGSAITLSDVLITSVDEAYTQTMAYVVITDGAVTTAGAAVPAPVVTPWIAPTPEPTPSPEPTPTPEPTPGVVAPDEPAPEGAEAPAPVQEKDSRKTIVTVLIGVIVALLLSTAVIVIVSVRNNQRRKRRRKRKANAARRPQDK